MLLNDSCFRDISLTKQKTLQRRHFISAGIGQGTQAGLLKPYESSVCALCKNHAQCLS